MLTCGAWNGKAAPEPREAGHRPGPRAVCPIFLTGDQYSLIQAGVINRLADSAERIEPLLATLELVEEVSNCPFDQFVVAPIVAVSEFLLDLFCQIPCARYARAFSRSSCRFGVMRIAWFTAYR
jgi:hypothetical protein